MMLDSTSMAVAKYSTDRRKLSITIHGRPRGGANYEFPRHREAAAVVAKSSGDNMNRRGGDAISA